MKFLENDEILFFLHIPKTAGISLGKFIDKRIPYIYDNHTYNVQEEFLKKYGEKINEMAHIRGHYNLLILNKIMKKTKKLVILREPIGRVKSAYYEYIKGFEYHKEIFRFSDDIKGGCSFSEFINDEKLFNIYSNNKYALMLGSGYLNCFSTDTIPDLESITRKAMETLKSFDAVGLQEEMEKTLLKLCYECGWKPQKSIGEFNSTTNELRQKYPTDLEEKEEQKLRDKLKYDYDIYNFAKDIFYSETEGLTYEKVLNNYHEVLYTKKRIYNYLSDGNIDFNNGWYNKFYNDGWYTNQTEYRWSGPATESEIDFSIEANEDFLIKLNFLYSHNGIPKDMTIFVNGEEIDGLFLHRGICRLIITQEIYLKSPKVTAVKIIVSNTTIPPNNNFDRLVSRKVGIAIRKVRIAKAGFFIKLLNRASFLKAKSPYKMRN